MTEREDLRGSREEWPAFDPESAGVLPLAANEIHLWRARLDVDEAKLGACEALLSPDEQERAHRFRFPEHRNRFMVARGTLRQILGIHLQYAPDQFQFFYGEHGKPGLAAPAGTGVEFNVSHSANLAIYAVAQKRCVGVDVEFIKPDGSWQRIADQYFTPEEAGDLAKLPEEAMRDKFFELWSAKEARLKALGVGLRFSLDPSGDEAWTVCKLSPQAGYAAAVAFATQAEAPVIRRHHFVG